MLVTVGSCYGTISGFVKHPVAALCFAGGAATIRQVHKFYDLHAVWQWKRQDVACRYFLMQFVDALPINPEVPFFRHALRACPGLGKAQKPEQPVNSHYRTNSASAANALPSLAWTGRGGSAERRVGRHRQREGAGGP